MTNKRGVSVHMGSNSLSMGGVISGPAVTVDIPSRESCFANSILFINMNHVELHWPRFGYK